MWFAEYWDDFLGEYVSVCYDDRDEVRIWCVENNVDYYTDWDGKQYSV